MPRALLFSFQQPLDEPPAHQFSRQLIPQLLALRSGSRPLVTRLDQHAFQIVVEEKWHEIKQRLTVKKFAVQPRRVSGKVFENADGGRLNPPNYMTMTFQAYPEPFRDCYGHQHRAFLAACRKAKQELAAT